MAKDNSTKDVSIIFDGVMTYNRLETKDYRGRALANPVNRFSVKADDISAVRQDVIATGFVDVEDRFCPKWLRDDTVEYVNLKSRFDVPTKIDNLEQTTHCDINVGAKVRVKMIVKADGNIYPISFKVLENGAEHNPFEGM